MKNYIVLLRGVNVSGKNRIKMAELRAVLENAGFTNVGTYIQSGNIILSSEIESPDEVSRAFEKTITESFGLIVPAITITPDYLGKAIMDNPFLSVDVDTKALHLTFLWQEPETEKSDYLASLNYPPDKIFIKNNLIYYFTPEGLANTKFTNAFLERKLSIRATTRNWRTCLALIEMSKA